MLITSGSSVPINPWQFFQFLKNPCDPQRKINDATYPLTTKTAHAYKP